MQQPVVPVVPPRAERRLPSATFLVALLALLVALVNVEMTLAGGHNSSPCGDAEIRVVSAASFPAPWHLASMSYLSTAGYGTLLHGDGAATSVSSAGQLDVSVACLGSAAADVMREYRAVPPVNATSIPAPLLGDDALAFENAAGGAPQFFVFVRRGGLVASVTSVGDVPETQVAQVSAALDRAMAQTPQG